VSARRNEVEERRVIRLLAGLTDDVPALRDDEIESLLREAPVASRHVRSRRPVRSLSAFAAAAVAALAFLVQFEARGEHASSTSSSRAPIASFPEGNALQLLLTASETR
jgi:hypothetical protein